MIIDLLAGVGAFSILIWVSCIALAIGTALHDFAPAAADGPPHYEQDDADSGGTPSFPLGAPAVGPLCGPRTVQHPLRPTISATTPEGIRRVLRAPCDGGHG